MKAVDYFMLTSFGFIFAALIEYIIVLNTPNVLVDSFYCGKKKQKNEPVQAQVNNTNQSITDWFSRFTLQSDYVASTKLVLLYVGQHI